MNQVDALFAAVGALESYAEQGDDECGEAAGVLNEMVSCMIQRRARAKYRREYRANVRRGRGGIHAKTD